MQRPSRSLGSVSALFKTIRPHLVGICLSVALAFVAFLTITALYRQATRDVIRGLDSLSTVLADQADHALQAMELAQDAVVEGLRESSDPASYAAAAGSLSLHQELRARISSLPQVNALTVLDHTGRLLNFSRRWPIPSIDLSDRDYFQELAADPERQRVVSRPFQNRGDGIWTIFIARKITAADGTFLGAVLGAVELRYFQDLYNRIVPAEDFVVGVFRNDGILLTRFPHREDATGAAFPRSTAMTLATAGIVNGNARATSPIDGSDRFVSVRSLAHYPMRLYVSREAAIGLAPFRQQAAAVALVAILLAAGLNLSLMFARRKLRIRENRTRAEERIRAERDLRKQHAAFGVALDNMTQGLCLFSGAAELVVMNARFAELYGIPPELSAGGTSAVLIQNTIVDRLSAGCDSRDMLVRPSGGVPLRSTIHLVDGRALDIVRAPVPGGGWVCTHEDVTEQRRAAERMRFLAGHDVLTNLPNRRLFEERVEETLLAGANADIEAALLCIDLDRFKQINDVFGHPAGDTLLSEVARRLDTFADRCVPARIGGDEFALLAPTLADGMTPAGWAQAIIDTLTEPVDLAGTRVEIGCSIGIALFPQDGDTYDRLLIAADMALFKAKRLSKGGFVFFEAAMDSEARARHELARDLKAAIGTSQLHLHYQPQFDVATGDVLGFEALLRWNHPLRGPVSPAQFIPIAEETGLILPIGAWVLRAACEEAARWERPLGIAVNLSIAQFQQEGLAEVVNAALRDARLAPGRLELEVTESLFLHDTARAQDLLLTFKRDGVRVAIDDFGTGYSSLLTLQSFPFDRIKIDRSFVDQIGVNPKGAAIVQAIIALGASLGIAVIAEGIETEDQLAFLRRYGCAEMQGYLRGRPQPIAAYRSLLASEDQHLHRAIPNPSPAKRAMRKVASGHG